MFILVFAIAAPSLLITVLAMDSITDRREEDVRASYVNCSTCYRTTSTGICSHSGSFSCSADSYLAGTFSCLNTNIAKTKLTASANSNGYKEAYVYERDSSGATKTDLKTSSGVFYPTEASVSPAASYTPVCVRHEVGAPDPYSSNTRIHTRNYQ